MNLAMNFKYTYVFIKHLTFHGKCIIIMKRDIIRSPHITNLKYPNTHTYDRGRFDRAAAAGSL